MIKPILIIITFLTYPDICNELLNSNSELLYAGSSFAAVCPEPDEGNLSVLEEFLTSTEWSSERAETNTGGLSVSQIMPLNDSSHSSICATFNKKYEQYLNEMNGISEKAYNVNYYKVDRYYFVVITIRQSEEPDYIISVLEYLDVYNQNLEPIKGYAF